MKFRKAMSLTSVLLGASALAGCGGDGGGGVNSVGAVSPPPAPTNTSLASLRASQTFANNAATSTASFDLATSKTLSGSTTVAPLTIAYDAGSNSYMLSTQGRSQTFAPADVNSSASSNGENVYIKTDGTNRDRLTLISASVPGASTNGPQYVGMGYWQRNTGNAGTQNTTFDIFTYGLDTPAGAVPRTGQAAYSTAVFGLSTTPGNEPVAFQGTGRFDVNFLTGVFSTSASTTETGLVTGYAIDGGGVGITGSGHLSSSDGTFSGTVGYGGANNTHGQGPLTGRFYGPAGTELGATFSASGSDGSAASGAIEGLQNPSLAPMNLNLTNLVADQLYYIQGEQFVRYQGPSGNVDANVQLGYSQAQQTLAGNFSVDTPSTEFSGGNYAATDQVAASQPNFTTYQKTVNGQTSTLDLYKTGAANTELALTYLSFGRWAAVVPESTNIANVNFYFVYGFRSDNSAIAARTGTASYNGVAYGGALNSATGAAYDVTGTSAFNVDFSHSTYSGTLALKGNGSMGAINFGNFGFAGVLNSGVTSPATLIQSGSNVGTINPGFYGPAGEEIGGPFQVYMPIGQAGKATTIAGVAVAKGG